VVSLCLRSKPVNALSPALCTELTNTLNALEEDEDVKGVLLTSAIKGIFSAGIDLNAFLITEERTVGEVAEFWTAMQQMWLTLYMTPLATVAAISGHSPAGGCLLALSCDARVMAQGKYGIGLNEVQMGLVAPTWLSNLLKETVGQRRAETMLSLGQLLSPDEALEAGVVDEVVPAEEVEAAALARLGKLMEVPSTARATAKQMLRRDAAEALRENVSEDLDEVMRVVTSDETQQNIRAYLASLKKEHM